MGSACPAVSVNPFYSLEPVGTAVPSVETSSPRHLKSSARPVGVTTASLVLSTGVTGRLSEQRAKQLVPPLTQESHEQMRTQRVVHFFAHRRQGNVRSPCQFMVGCRNPQRQTVTRPKGRHFQ
jgi:hypothetical protein